MNIKIHKSHRNVVAICDTDLIGKTFEEGNKQLYVKESFFKGDEMSEEEIIKMMKDWKAEDATFNIVGEESTKTAIKAGIISPKSILKIGECPYTLILL